MKMLIAIDAKQKQSNKPAIDICENKLKMRCTIPSGIFHSFASRFHQLLLATRKTITSPTKQVIFSILQSETKEQ
jgi:hypothetical protein